MHAPRFFSIRDEVFVTSGVVSAAVKSDQPFQRRVHISECIRFVSLANH